MRVMRPATLCRFVPIIFVLAAAPAAAEQVVGTVEQVQPGGHRFVLRTPAGVSQTVILAAKAQVSLADQPGTPDDLGPGANVRVEGTARAQGLQATSVRILGPHFQEHWQPYPLGIMPAGPGRLLLGTIIEVNPTARTLGLLTSDSRVEVSVPASAVLLRGTAPLGLEALARGDRVRILLDRAQDWSKPAHSRIKVTAQEVRLLSARGPVTPLPYPTAACEGVVTSVFQAEQALVMRVSRGSYAVLTADASLQYGATPVTFRRFAPGDLVRMVPEPVRYPYYGEPPHRTGFTTVRASRVDLLMPADAKGAVLRGMIENLDLASGRFTLGGRTIVTGVDTSYLQGSRTLGPRDLRNGQSVEVVGLPAGESVEASRILVLAEPECLAAMAGEVSGLDPAAGSFRLGETVVATDAGTQVVWPGGAFRLADLRTGDRVEVVGERRGETLFAERIQVSTAPRGRPAVDQRGKVLSVDDRRRMLVLGARGQKVYVPPRAPIVRKADTLEMADLRAGHDLQVQGYLVGDTLVAVTVRRWD